MDVVIKNTHNNDLISRSFLDTFYIYMPPIMKEYLHNNMEYWKGEVYDKLIYTLNQSQNKYQHINNSIFNIWLDLSKSLDKNKDKQERLVELIKLDYLNKLVENKSISFDQLYDINFFDTAIKEVEAALYYKISSYNYEDFCRIWNRNVEIYLWTIENLLSKNKLGEEKNNNLISCVSYFLLELHRILNEEPDYFHQFETSKLIIDKIESGKFNFLNDIYDKIIQ